MVKMVSGEQLSVQELRHRLGAVLASAQKHEIFVMASSLAYSTALALAPFVLITLSLAAVISANLKVKIYQALVEAVGDNAGMAMLKVLDGASKYPQLSEVSGIVGVVVLAVSASVIFSQLKIALDKINEHAYAKYSSGIWNFVKNKIFSVALVFGFSFLAVVSLIFTFIMEVWYPDGLGFAWQILTFSVNLTLFAILFAAIYRFVPTDKADLKSCCIAGFISALFFLIGKKIIGVYLANIGLESLYGAAGSLIVLLVWVYYISLTLLFSYEFTKDVVFKKDLTVET